MAGPAFKSAGARATSAGAVTLTPALPTAGHANGLLIAAVTSKNNATHSCGTAGWSLVSQVNSGAGFTASLWCARGDAVAPTFTWTGSAACSAVIMNYLDPAGVVHVGVGASTSNVGTTSPHSTSSITTTHNNALVVYVDASAANTALTTPTSYTSNLSLGSATDAGHTDSGSQSIATSGSSSTAISTAGAAAAWVEWQVEIYSIYGQMLTSRVAVGAVAARDPSSMMTSRVAVGAVVWATSGYMMTSRVAVGVVVSVPIAATRRRQSGIVN